MVSYDRCWESGPIWRSNHLYPGRTSTQLKSWLGHERFCIYVPTLLVQVLERKGLPGDNVLQGERDGTDVQLSLRSLCVSLIHSLGCYRNILLRSLPDHLSQVIPGCLEEIRRTFLHQKAEARNSSTEGEEHVIYVQEINEPSGNSVESVCQMFLLYVFTFAFQRNCWNVNIFLWSDAANFASFI